MRERQRETECGKERERETHTECGKERERERDRMRERERERDRERERQNGGHEATKREQRQVPRFFLCESDEGKKITLGVYFFKIKLKRFHWFIFCGF